jgi:PAS domain-containing protein
MFIHFLSDFLIRAALLISLPQEQRRAQKIADDMNNALAQQLRLITLQAERTEAKFARMAAEAPTGVFVVDVEGKPLYSNGAYLRMLGETQSEQTHPSPDAVTWESHIHEDDLPRFQEIWHRAIEHKMPFTVEHRLKRPWISVDRASGQEISGETWLLANGFPELGSDGKITSIQGWLTNISHRKFTDSLVSRKLEEALENKRQTENFIDMTSQ